MSKGKTAQGIAIKQIEMRRCVVCRQVRHKSELIRVVKTIDGIKLDDTGKIEGRRAYVCKSVTCAGNVTLHPVSALKFVHKRYHDVER